MKKLFYSFVVIMAMSSVAVADQVQPKPQAEITDVDQAVEFLNSQLQSNPDFDLESAGSDLLEAFSPELIEELFSVSSEEDDSNPLLHKVASRNSGFYVLVDVSDKQLYVYQNGRHVKTCPVSTARRGKSTPRGTYSVKWRAGKNHASSIYGTPMPYTTNFTGPYAIHAAWGKKATANLGRANLSAGCVRTTLDCAYYIYKRSSNGTVTVRN